MIHNSNLLSYYIFKKAIVCITQFTNGIGNTEHLSYRLRNSE